MKVILDGATIEEFVNILEARLTTSIEQKILTLIQEKAERKETFLTRKEAAQSLGVSLSTLHTLSKEGAVQSYRLRGQIRYKESEIEGALEQVKNLKYKRG
jgi:excisionase family DNA binding protein